MIVAHAQVRRRHRDAELPRQIEQHPADHVVERRLLDVCRRRARFTAECGRRGGIFRAHRVGNCPAQRGAFEVEGQNLHDAERIGQLHRGAAQRFVRRDDERARARGGRRATQMPQQAETIEARQRELGYQQPRRTGSIDMLSCFLAVTKQHDIRTKLERNIANG